MNRELYPLRTWVPAVVLIPGALGAAGLAIVALVDRKTLAFDGAHLAWIAVAVPVAAGLMLYGLARRRRALNLFTAAPLASLLGASLSPARKAARAALLVCAVFFLTAAVIGPRWGMYLEKQKVRGVDIVVALDVSRSMLARDVEPNRIERAKRELRQQLTERGAFRGANRLGLLAFAGATSLRLPLTTDHVAFRNKLDLLRVGSVPRGGTAIAKAIDAAVDLFSISPPNATRILLLVTDGEDHEGEAAAAASAAYKDHGVRVYTVAAGDPSSTFGAQVPMNETPNSKALLFEGQIVFSRVDPAGLEAIAKAGQGEYVPLESFPRLVNKISSMEGVELSTEERLRHRPQYQWFLMAAIVLLLAEGAISERRTVPADEPLRAWQQEAA